MGWSYSKETGVNNGGKPPRCPFARVFSFEIWGFAPGRPMWDVVCFETMYRNVLLLCGITHVF